MPRCLSLAAVILVANSFVQSSSASPDAVVGFNEIHYNPAGSSENGEWIELFNQMGIKVDISGWHFTGIDYTFPAGTIVNPGAHVVVAKTPLAGQFGPFAGNIGNGGENLKLINQSERLMDEIDFGDNDPWPAGADNSGSTLAKRQPYSASLPPENWVLSSQTGGTPGTANFPSPPVIPAIRFNEMQAANATAGAFFVELANTGTSSVNYSGMVLSRGTDTPTQYTLPAGTLAPGALLLLDEATLGFRPANDEKLFLFNAGKTQVIDSRQAGNRVRGLSGTTGSEWLYPTAASPGTANGFAFNESVVISEIQYNPPSLPPTPEIPAVYQTDVLFGYNSVWRYNAANDNLPTGWAGTVHPVSGNWKSGTGPIGKDGDVLPVPLVTTISPYSSATIAYYFEREFTLSQAQVDTAESLEIVHQIDDGAVFYLNGVELPRYKMAAGTVGPETQASSSVGTAASLVSLSVPAAGLLVGSNRISVEVHQFGTTSSDVVFGMKLDLKRQMSPFIASQPMRDSDNQWLELANRSGSAVDLTDWTLDDGITHAFAPGTQLAAGEHACVVRDPVLFAAAYPGARILGTFSGSLSRTGEIILLRDPAKNPADRVRYYDGGQWPEFADGGGASLELRDLDADNNRGGSWSASNESSHTAWKTYSYRSTAAASNGPDSQWSEFNFGMLGAGEMWIDDVSVIELPDGAATQKLADTGFNNSGVWRLRGNHRHSQIINEPGNAGNKILRLVATGPTEHMHNQIETTLASAVVNGREYQISFRARWVTGINQLHTRLYFNRAARMNVVDRQSDPGTPSAPNSTAVANIGPSFSALNHSPAVPAVSQACTISAAASDPDGMASMTLFYSVNGGAFQSSSMTLVNGRYQASVPGQAAGAVVQFYLRGMDALNAISYFPAAAGSSRALYKVNDNAAATNGLHNFRLITTNADRVFMHTLTEVMSNDRIEATIIDREGDIYYGAGVRLKSSQRGRDDPNRVGYNIEFPSDGLYRGIHPSVAIDRSEGQVLGQRELLFDMMISNSGGAISRYNDLIRILSPDSALTGTAILQMARYDDVFLDSQFGNGSDGNIHEYELVYYPTTVDVTGAKLPSPDLVINVNRIYDQGDSIEPYRWSFLNKINREAENFTPIINYCKLFSLTGAAFESAVPGVVDVDTWFRGMAYAVLTGAGDNAAAGSFHNGIYHARPDGRIIFLPHDMDYSFDANRSIFANAECAALTANPARKRIYLGHLHDIISTTYYNSYMSIWSTHFATLDPAQDWAAELTYMTNRSNNVLSQINSQVPSVAFAITTPSPLNTGGLTATISGTGWVNVRDIRIAGSNAPLNVTWTGSNTWQVTVAAAPGLNNVTLEALNFSGAVIGSGSIAINATTIIEPADMNNLVVSEIMYNPALPDPTEVDEGFSDADQFEYIELMNISENPVNMTGVRFIGGIDYDFTAATTLAAGARVIVARDRNAFIFRHPGSAGSLADGAFLNATGLDNAGEGILLIGAMGTIRSFSYGDDPPWPAAADGGGHSLVLIAPAGNPDHSLPSNWRTSALPVGNPGTGDAVAFTGSANADDDGDGLSALVEYAMGTSDQGANPSGISMATGLDGFVTVNYQLNLAADDVVTEIQSSGNLADWSPDFAIISQTPTGTGTVQMVARSLVAAPDGLFIRLAVATR